MNKTAFAARKTWAPVLWQLFMLPVLILALASCGTSKPYDETESWSPARIYEEAKDEMASANYDRAISLYEKLESRYPYGRYAQQAQMDTAYAYYKSGDNVQALAATDRFIKLYPNHRDLDYIYYLRGLINFNENRGIISLISGEDLSERDPKGTRAAFDAFKEVVTRFPNSKYAEDSKARLQYLVNSLAQNELAAARYYYRRGAYLASLNRSQEVIKRFEQTPSVEEALFLSYRCYQKLNMAQLAQDTKRVIDKNFPNSPYWNMEVPEKQNIKTHWWQVWKD
ncbi:MULTISPECIES: outer membrane protein assembly factor BamD [Limnobacter]|nr:MULTISPECIES: outer membrane protein assembly factor BamD [Limnobacter]HEX5485447.1 outer membrane protein assembly factor BamD [Limnobacter sp.]